uniref:Tryptophan 2,3-dioxygenase n=1 Tax=Ditylenchus dipsaci TaxID=166011 RepID=A0A915D3C5_9BILA
MACPMGYGSTCDGPEEEIDQNNHDEDLINACKDAKQGATTATVNNPQADHSAAFSDHVSYKDYLQLGKLLSCQDLRSEEANQVVPDEHLFIIIHQTYELWFKQIIYDIDHVRKLLYNKVVDETKTLQIVSLLERTVRILKLLVDQILILETMSPLDFVEFRKYLTSASGFQSLQFRLLENKEVFVDHKDKDRLSASEEEPSLFVLIDRWLSRTPGIYEEEVEEQEHILQDIVSSTHVELNGITISKPASTVTDECSSRTSSVDDESSPTAKKRKTFWNRYLEAVNTYLADLNLQAQDPSVSAKERRMRKEEYVKTSKSFETITDQKEYQTFLDKQERRLSHNALKGALMIYFYRDMPRFSQPYQILTFLMDIDSLLQKWRYNHVMLVQRMLGSKQGSGGSSGYLYLRTTVSDRYKVFIDIFNLSTWLIPRLYIPKLSPTMVKLIKG